MTPQTAAEAILTSLSTRKGFPAFLATISPQTVERMVDEWAGIIGCVNKSPESEQITKDM